MFGLALDDFRLYNNSFELCTEVVVSWSPNGSIGSGDVR